LKLSLSILLSLLVCEIAHSQQLDFLHIGVLPKGRLNTITDVAGVKVGQVTLIRSDSIRTGVTAIIPHDGNMYQEKVPAAIFIGNGYGKLSGISQVDELGNIETPIILTNTLSVPTAMNALISYTLAQKGNENVRSVNTIVGETNDGYLNDIRGRHVQEADILKAIETASADSVQQGNVGAGTGTVCFGFKGGIGTSSRVLPEKLGGYSVGVLVQTNFGGVLEIDGVEIGELLGQYYLKDAIKAFADGSCMIVVATDAPLDARNLKRLAKRAFMGLAKTGGIASNGSGDYVICFSTARENRIISNGDKPVSSYPLLENEETSPLFMAAIEATEEAIIQSLFHAETMKGFHGHTIQSLPKEKVRSLLQQYKNKK